MGLLLLLHLLWLLLVLPTLLIGQLVVIIEYKNTKHWNKFSVRIGTRAFQYHYQ